MKQHFIIKNNSKRLLLFFAGWGMDETPFLQIRPTDTDWMVCYDYRSLEFDTDLLQKYSEIRLIAWSMGGMGSFSTHETTPVSAHLA